MNNQSDGLWYLGISDNDSNCSLLTADNQRFVFRLGFMDGEANGLFSQEFVKLDTDYFLVSNYDTQVMKFYINEVLVEEREIAQNVEVNTSNVTVGAQKYIASFPYYFNGLIDQIRIYDEALPLDKIQFIYEKKI